MHNPPKILFVANVAKEHILKFHIPAIKMFTDLGWLVDVACGGAEPIPYCHHQYILPYTRATLNWNTLRGFSQVCKIAHTEKYDVIYCHTAVGGMAGRLAGIGLRRKGTKTVFFDHGYDFYKGAPILNWLTFFAEEWLMARFTDATICINQEDFDITKRVLRPKKTYYIEGVGFDPARFIVEDRNIVRKHYRDVLGIPQDATVLIYLAELIDNKNQKLLMDALKIVLTTRPNTFLVLAGFDHTDGEYTKYAEQIGVNEHVKYLGWREDVGELYATADICTASSKSEGLGLNLVEAMYSGLPVIATENRGHSTIIEDGKNGFLVKSHDPNDFAQRIIEIADNFGIKDSLVRHGLITQKKYQISTVLEKLIGIFEEVINE